MEMGKIMMKKKKWLGGRIRSSGREARDSAPDGLPRRRCSSVLQRIYPGNSVQEFRT